MAERRAGEGKERERVGVANGQWPVASGQWTAEDTQ